MRRNPCRWSYLQEANHGQAVADGDYSTGRGVAAGVDEGLPVPEMRAVESFLGGVLRVLSDYPRRQGCRGIGSERVWVNPGVIYVLMCSCQWISQ